MVIVKENFLLRCFIKVVELRSYFDLTKEENQRICFNYRNLQPLWASENNTKKAKVPDNVEEIVEFLRKEINNEILYRN